MSIGAEQRAESATDAHKRLYAASAPLALIALIELDGRATQAELRTAIGNASVNGHRLRALRNRSLIEPWTDVVILTFEGWTEARRLLEAA